MLQGLKSNGVSLDKLTQQSYIRRFDLENPDTYLPLEVGYEFLNKVKHSQGVDNISSEFYGGFQVADLSDYGQFLSTCPDLYSVLINAVRYDYLIQTHGRVQLKTDGAFSTFSMRHIDPPTEGRHISEQINMAMFIEAFQYVLGSDWTPLEVHITSSKGYWINKLLPSSDYILKTNCEEIAFRFKTSELSARNKYYNNQIGIADRGLNSIGDMTEHVLNSLSGNYIPTIDEFAEFFGYSKRTIIRSFIRSNSSFKDKVEKHLFMRSLKSLGNGSLSVEEISDSLGYAHPSNFIRAFKRWTSVTPNFYRQQQYSL